MNDEDQNPDADPPTTGDPPDPLPPDIELISTNHLIAELLSRCDHGIIALMQTQIGGPDTSKYCRSWTGNTHACVGLAADISSRILENFRLRQTDSPRGEEGPDVEGPDGTG